MNARHPLIAAGVALIAFSTSSPASEALAKKNNCFGCHAVATKVMGPAWRDVGAKYAGQPGAEDQLVHSIREGMTTLRVAGISAVCAGQTTLEEVELCT